jgi:hypothetical protein
MSDPQYSLLKDSELEAFSEELRQLLTKTKLIQQLNDDVIQYMHVLDLRCHGEVPLTLEHIEKALRRSFSKEDSCVFVLYSNDRLKHEAPGAWETLYHEFISKRQHATPRTTLIYADFTNCHYDLEHLTIVNLPIQVSETPLNHPPGKKLTQIILSSSFFNQTSFIYYHIDKPSNHKRVGMRFY